MTDAEFMAEYVAREREGTWVTLWDHKDPTGENGSLAEEFQPCTSKRLSELNVLEALAKIPCRCSGNYKQPECQHCIALRAFREKMEGK